MSNRSYRDLCEAQAPLIDQLEKLVGTMNEEKRSLTEDEQSTFDSLEGQVQELKKQADVQYRFETMDGADQPRATSEPTFSADPIVQQRSLAATPSQPNRGPDPSKEKWQLECRAAFSAWAMGKRARREDVAVADRIGFDCRNDFLDLDLGRGLFGHGFEQRGTDPQKVGAGIDGGFLVPEDFSSELEMALKDASGMRQSARIITTASGSDLPHPAVDDTAQRATIVAEATASTVNDVDFTSVTFKAWTYRSLMQASRELLQDSFTDIPSLLGNILGTRLGRGLNADATVGDGTTAPEGVTTNNTSALTLTTDDSPTYAELLTLIHSIDPLYRADPSFLIMASDTVIKNMRGLADSQNQPIWNLPVAAGMPPTILGVPVVLNNDMPTGGTGKSMACGAFNRYVFRDVAQQGVQIQRLDELYAASGLVGFLLFSRHDGRMIAPAAHGAIKVVTNAT